MKTLLEISGYSDVVIYTELYAKPIKDDDGNIASKDGDIIPHGHSPKYVTFYRDKYDEHGVNVGVDAIKIDANTILNVAKEIENIKNLKDADCSYYRDIYW